MMDETPRELGAIGEDGDRAGSRLCDYLPDGDSLQYDHFQRDAGIGASHRAEWQIGKQNESGSIGPSISSKRLGTL